MVDNSVLTKNYRSKLHVVYINTSKPPPSWLRYEIPLWELKKQFNLTSNQIHTIKYWRHIYERTPPWVTHEMIKPFYLEAWEERKKGNNIQVDHIVPLNAYGIHGLHVPANLQLLTYEENMRKSNLWWPDMPNQQLELFNNEHNN